MISTVELECALFPSISEEELQLFQSLVASASHILWLTGGNALRGQRPDFAVAPGLSRSVMLEQVALRFLVLDIDDTSTNCERTVANVLSVLVQGLDDSTPDFEFAQRKGVLHVSRFEPDMGLNTTFRRKQGLEMMTTSLEDAKPCELLPNITKESISAVFQRLEWNSGDLPYDHVQVDIRSIGLDTYSAQALQGQVEIEGGFPLMGMVGTISQTGRDVRDSRVGDLVVFIAPHAVSSTVQVPEMACIRLPKGEFDLSCLYACGIAMYAIHHYAIPRSCNSFLVCPGGSIAGVTAIQALKSINKDIYATYSSAQEKQFLMTKLHLGPEHLIDVVDATSPLPAERAVKFDCVLTTSNQASMALAWNMCADFGCMIDIVGRSSVYHTYSMPPRGITHTALGMQDMLRLYARKPQSTWRR